VERACWSVCEVFPQCCECWDFGSSQSFQGTSSEVRTVKSPVLSPGGRPSLQQPDAPLHWVERTFPASLHPAQHHLLH
jgi:hypothetical protein